MNRSQSFNTFKLNNHFIVQDQISSETCFHNQIFMLNCYGMLTFKAYTHFLQFVTKYLLVNALK